MTQAPTAPIGSQHSQSGNPLLNVGFRIPFDQIRPEHAESAVDTLLEQTRERLEHLARAGERDYADFMADLDTLTEQLDTVRVIVGHLDGVVTSPEWQAAKRAILPKVTEFYTGLSLHPGLWSALKGFAQTDAGRGLDPVRARHLGLTIDEFRRQGADLAEAEKARLLEVNTRLAQVTNDFSKNVLDATAAFELYVPTERLAGVPGRVQEATRLDAEKHGQEGHRLTLHLPTLEPILTYADDRELRRELWLAQNSVGTGSVGTGEGRDNRPLVGEILRLRREQARLLGFRDFADYVLQDRMAGGGERALTFERDMEARVRPFYERENAELEAFYHEQAGADAPALEAWDVGYWAEKQRQAKYAFDEEALRPYFAMDSVLSGLFEICRRVFGITVTEAQAPGWHPEVRYYDIRDEAGTHLASFYTDWFPRDTKRAGAWMNAFLTGGPREEGVEPHLGLMCGNMTAPSGDTPALLSVREVETVFHEFGHLLHHAMSKVEVRSLSGTRVAWDFVELPSQIMENWVLEREALDLFARHWQTGERLPDDLFEKLVAARNYRAANATMRQLSFGTVDLSLHVEFDPDAPGADPIRTARETMARFYPYALPEDYARIAQFGHLFSSPVGYGAGYYSYKWAEVLDADAFSRFAQEGLFNRETGRAYVESILSKGNSKDAAELYRDFMGRDPDAEALLRRSGLVEA